MNGNEIYLASTWQQITVIYIVIKKTYKYFTKYEKLLIFLKTNASSRPRGNKCNGQKNDK